jgi:hypothetical protein
MSSPLASSLHYDDTMMRIAGACVLFTTLVATTACGVGDDAATGGGSDDRNDKLGIVCNASFKKSGTFVPGLPARPVDDVTMMPITGCWPVGTWTFTAAMDTNECKAAPEVIPSYSFKVDRIEGADMQGLVDKYTNLTTLGDKKWHLSVSSNGQGCEGSLEFATPDGLQYWNMQPVLADPLTTGGTPTTTITGSGDYAMYKTDSWPWKPAP